MKYLIVYYFSYEYLQEFLGYEPFCFENILIFFALHGDFVHITSFIRMLQASFFQEFKIHGFVDVYQIS